MRSLIFYPLIILITILFIFSCEKNFHSEIGENIEEILPKEIKTKVDYYFSLPDDEKLIYSDSLVEFFKTQNPENKRALTEYFSAHMNFDISKSKSVKNLFIKMQKFFNTLDSISYDAFGASYVELDNRNFDKLIFLAKPLIEKKEQSMKERFPANACWDLGNSCSLYSYDLAQKKNTLQLLPSSVRCAKNSETEDCDTEFVFIAEYGGANSSPPVCEIDFFHLDPDFISWVDFWGGELAFRSEIIDTKHVEYSLLLGKRFMNHSFYGNLDWTTNFHIDRLYISLDFETCRVLRTEKEVYD